MKIRIAVFVDEQKFPLDTEADEYDAVAIHLLLRLVPSLEPIGTIRLITPKYKLTRLCVLPRYRKLRLGDLLVKELHKYAIQDARTRSLDQITIVTHSQIPVKAFYKRSGYVEEGEEFDEEGAPHQKMLVTLQVDETRKPEER
ncbi:hypothetical protein BOTBODRAFT_37553 [Botryobasidium botryosum FD-172 SS1]|uniref:N-acetyltransferase domain-containing protein n=1 Tax=Botryobasidium botryosum (strain FD-172 SS1) TaxID=930990 RepID=A0A067MBA7_BOTB1|nr:hypothetical protein BOTBODRAFT_37553 [Botryobasidium botryosum FD-172 SS1]